MGLRVRKPKRDLHIAHEDNPFSHKTALVCFEDLILISSKDDVITCTTKVHFPFKLRVLFKYSLLFDCFEKLQLKKSNIPTKYIKLVFIIIAGMRKQIQVEFILSV